MFRNDLFYLVLGRLKNAPPTAFAIGQKLTVIRAITTRSGMYGPTYG